MVTEIMEIKPTLSSFMAKFQTNNATRRKGGKHLLLLLLLLFSKLYGVQLGEIETGLFSSNTWNAPWSGSAAVVGVSYGVVSLGSKYDTVQSHRFNDL